MGSLVRTSEAATLALHAAAILAGANGEPVSAGTMADNLNASEAHLAKVLQRLAKAGLVRGRRGPGGGFRLTRSPEEVTLREVYEAIEGHMDIGRCMFGQPVCGRNECAVGDLFERLNREITESLGAMTLADIELRELAL